MGVWGGETEPGEAGWLGSINSNVAFPLGYTVSPGVPCAKGSPPPCLPAPLRQHCDRNSDSIYNGTDAEKDIQGIGQ